MTKFDHLIHQDLLISYLSASRPYPPFFVQNPIWLSKGPYFFEEKLFKGIKCLYIYKKTKIYNNEVFYHVGTPLTLIGDLEVEGDAALDLLDQGTDLLLTENHKTHLYFPIKESPDQQPEFVYHSSTYGFQPNGDLQLTGGEFASWRQSLKKTSELLEVKYYHKSFPMYLPQHLTYVLDKWKEYRDKYIGKHNSWYVTNYKNISNCLLMVFYYKGKPVSFNISQKIGKTIFFLDEKTIMGVLPNSFTLSKAYQILCFNQWIQISSESDLWMTSGLGDKSYTHDSKTFDLDKHKQLLKPSQLLNMYKVRGVKPNETV